MASITDLDFARNRESGAEISLLDVLAVLRARKRLIVTVTALAMGVTAAVVCVIPPSYTAEAVILPPQQDPSAQAMMMGSLAGLSGLSGLAGVGGTAGLWRSPAEMYIGVLKSRTVADALIAKYNLQAVYGRPKLTGARKALARHSDISTGRDSLIRIRVDDYDRKRAADLANAYVAELYDRNSSLAITSAGARRLFFERQLAQEKNVLADAEVALKKQQQASGLVLPQGQGEVLIRSMAQLHAEIGAREVQLQGMQEYAAAGNPQRQVLEQEIAALRSQMAKLEQGPPEGMGVAARKLPETGLEYVRRLRDVKYHEVLFEILSKQYEAARIDEARLAPIIQVIDAAVVPDQRSWPPRTLLTLGAGVAGLLTACAWVLVRCRGAVR